MAEIKADRIIDIIDGKKVKAMANIKEDDPLYPPYQLADILRLSKTEKPEVVIQKLEAILLKKNFSKFVGGKLSFKNNKFLVGTVDTFRLWRELLYTCLGRAYYENGEYKKSILYLEAVPFDSPFSKEAKLELGWALLTTNKNEQVKLLLESYEGKLFEQASSLLQNEFRLLQAYYLVSQKNYEKAIDLASDFSITHNHEQENLRLKLLTEAWFGKYLKELNALEFDEKVKLLTKITKLSRKISPEYHDAEFAFLAGEADWHLASVFRVRDPIKYKDIWWKYLSRAETWMQPFVNRSIKQKKAHMSEEAMFFSIALLWEMSKFKEASKRLVMLPVIFPQGEYLEDVYQMLGDYHYDEKRFKTAISYYDKLTKHGGEDKTAYGVYKAAWGFYNLQKKWTALRHLERLYLHYLKNKDNDNEKGKGLFREVREDLLTFMAELLDWKKGLRELDIFQHGEKEQIKFIADLAGSYHKIGRYDQAVNIWIHLLEDNYTHADAPGWLASIGKAYLAAVQKDQIAKVFNRFLRKVIEHHKEKKTLTKLDESISKIILTVHKEARKSENREDWLAVDQLYKIYENHFPKSTNARMWYFGAQRYENLQKFWPAITWYKKAAMIKDYPNHLDAAHSALRILSSINDRLSLISKKNKDNINEYKRISSDTFWYIQNFHKEESRKLAEFIHMESLYYQKTPALAERFIIARFNNDQEDVLSSWNLFVNHNKRLYGHKDWELINSLAYKILDSEAELKDEWRIILSKIYQESAFQTAYRKDKGNNSSYQEIKAWYLKSANRKYSDGFDKNISLKSWNNLLIYIFNNKRFDDFKLEYSKFKEVAEIQEANSFDNRNLIFNIHNLASKTHHQTGEFYKKAENLFKASTFSADQSERHAMMWDASLIFASYNDRANFLNCLKVIREQNPNYLRSKERRITLSRLFYYMQDYENAWSELKPFIGKALEAKEALLFVDIYSKAFADNSSLFKEMDEIRLKFKTDWLKIPYLSHLWAFDEMQRVGELTSNWEKSNDRLPASDLEGLKNIAGHVKMQLKELNQKKQEMQKSLIGYAPQVVGRVLCSAPIVTGQTIEQLTEITYKKLENPQWPQFLKRLEVKINELKTQQDAEQLECNNHRKKFFYYPKKLIGRIPCDYAMCFKEEGDTDEIIAFEEENKDLEIHKKVLGYLELGAHSRAEYIVSEVKNPDQLSFLMGIIRLAQGDVTNSAIVFKSLKDKKSKFDVKPYLKLIANVNKYDNL